MTTDPLYQHYWARKRLTAECPSFPVLRCSGRAIDGQVLGAIMQALRQKQRLLDVGAGSLAVRDALVRAGFNGKYETLDVGEEYEYTYSSLSQVSASLDAVLLLDVLEHLPLRDGLGLLQQAFALLGEGGVLVVQTPNARCVRSPFMSDMTHLHGYNLPDLWAYITTLGSECRGYRVAFGQPTSLPDRATDIMRKAVITRVLGLDYADNILLIATKQIG